MYVVAPLFGETYGYAEELLWGLYIPDYSDYNRVQY